MLNTFNTIHPNYVLTEVATALAAFTFTSAVKKTNSISKKVRANIRETGFLKHWCFTLPQRFPSTVEINQSLQIHYSENYDANSRATLVFSRTFVDGKEEITNWYPPKIEFQEQDEHYAVPWDYYYRVFDGSHNISIHNQLDYKNQHIDWIEWTFTYTVPATKANFKPLFSLLFLVFSIQNPYLIPLILCYALTGIIPSYSKVFLQLFYLQTSLFVLYQAYRQNLKLSSQAVNLTVGIGIAHIIISAFTAFKQNLSSENGGIPILELFSFLAILQIVTISSKESLLNTSYTLYGTLLIYLPFILDIVVPGNFMDYQTGKFLIQTLGHYYTFFGLFLLILGDMKFNSTENSSDVQVNAIIVQEDSSDKATPKSDIAIKNSKVFNKIPFLLTLIPIGLVVLETFYTNSSLKEPIFELH
ncbi:hypothetical protein TVAG_185630 [Trichomonas vaginalis G3]|uniref:Uncharacterized protein n=1 Tax=Trichomonas vaginalis (strain ATCC PRA-98 / G3) TaxID=412133 RepID=A2D8K7_TRIV3|nr:hypothetical protein TVAGG3_0392640 [Trichomonas vaginalis G3]EAY23256.1 hypothetical protein TVAG_185630 [Trichomonas vaginalis G3]KAI5534095.1 hypothetical protein TVAGG3_0392640 [Trichomonas vaginalis G3]|eukprot:XP_001584242.1 hypothetical protein [Trichomonas vaginalis G3]